MDEFQIGAITKFVSCCMTVKELQEALSDMPPHSPVVFSSNIKAGGSRSVHPINELDTALVNDLYENDGMYCNDHTDSMELGFVEGDVRLVILIAGPPTNV